MMVDELTACDGYLVTDARGAIQAANQTAAAMFRLSKQALIGRHVHELLALDEHGLRQLRKFEKGESDLEWETRLAPNGLASFSALLAVSALRDPSGRIVAMHWLIRDVSVQKQVEVGDRLLQALGERLLEGFSLAQSLSRLCEQLMQCFSYPLVQVAIREADGEISVCAQADESRSTVEPLRDKLTDEARRDVESVLETQSTLHLQEERDQGRPSLVSGTPYPAQLVVPVSTRNRAFGVLVLHGAHRDAFDPFTVEWFERFARHMAMVLLLGKDAEQLRLRGAAIASAGHAAFIMDSNGLIEWVNDAYARLTGYTAADLIGTIPECLRSDHVRAALRQARDSTAPGRFWRHELVAQRRDGRVYTVEQVLTPLRDDRGQVTHFVALHEDITVRKEAEARIFHLAHHDSLTDLPNRTMFYDRLKQALVRAKRHGRGVGVLFIDLDRLKPINDSLGHEMGDALLKVVADRLVRCVRRTDTIARLSGDEFTMVLQDVDRGQDAGRVAQKVLDSVSQPVTVEGRTIPITASVGIALYPFDATDPDVLIAQADRAMYRAKEKGGHCYQFVSEEMNAQAFERLMLEKSLEGALDRKEFSLHYQPEVTLESGRVAGVEALLRWQHPELGLILSSQFLPLIEQSELFDAIQEWVLETACRQRLAWSSEELSAVPISVNISCRRSDPGRLLKTVQRVLQKTGLDPQALRLEMTQSDARLLQGHSMVKALSNVGVESVLDDVLYDDGLVSLLRTLPFRRLKLAASLVLAVPGNPDSMKAIEQCLDVGRTLQVAVLAKGVESPDQVRFLRMQGCQAMQGHLCSRPLPGEPMTTLLRGWKSLVL